MNTLLKKEKNVNLNQHVISHLMGNPAENKAIHTAGSSGSADAAPRMTEYGRSMVEMLGVLAVMGVLSVAGIAGYNFAMNRHRANELLNEASKRAVVVAGQVTMGSRTPSLTEFTNPTGYTFDVKGPDGTKAWASGDNQFTLTITGVSEAVCNHMQNMKTALIQKFEPTDCATTATVKLSYNADLSMGTAEEGAENKCPAGGTYNETTGECVCEDVSSDSCCESGKSICVKEDLNTEECLEYSCCKTGKRTWVRNDDKFPYAYFSCFPGCDKNETEYRWVDYVCISCPKPQIYCQAYNGDVVLPGFKVKGQDACVDEPNCCNGKIYEYDEPGYPQFVVTGCCESENSEDCCPADVTCTWRE